MSESVLLRVNGEVEHPIDLRLSDLMAIPADEQILDVSRIAPNRKGHAVRLSGLLNLVRPKATANYLGLHSSTDNFHASIPLSPVRDAAFLVFRIDGHPLSTKDGGPIRFFIPDHSACRTAEIDECANVKFVDHIELTATRGFDNRPTDEQEHAKLHQPPTTQGR